MFSRWYSKGVKVIFLKDTCSLEKKISGRTDFLNTICKIYEADIDSCLSRIKVDNVLVGKIYGIKVVSPNKIITAVDFVTFRGNFNWKLIDNAVLCRCLTFARRRKATEPSSMPSWEIECKFQILRILLDLQIWVHAEKNTQWNITPQKNHS